MKNKKARIAVLVSGGGTNLQAIIDAQKSGVIKSGEITLVISNKKDAYALIRAEEAGIKTALITRQDYGKKFEKRIIDVLKDNNTDLIVLAGFMVILSREFTETFKNRIINVHPSLIPSFCGEGFFGLRVHEAVLRKGVKVTGATVHFVNEIPDGGEIIEQKAVRVYPNDTPEKLQKRVMRQAEWIILPKAVEIISERIVNNGNL
ncbi:MAG: phosphoribosylglycinamide formyltransferase [Clostridia bacterium]|nr:phosphoribosylglycinamide formyltransferase [Clostridia bacterium]